MEMENYSRGDIFVVKLRDKRLDAKIASQFKDELAEFVKNGNKNMLINLEFVEFMDSSGLGAIVSCLKNIGNKGKLMLCSLHPAVNSLIQLTRLNKIFQIYENEDKAIVSVEK